MLPVAPTGIRSPLCDPKSLSVLHASTGFFVFAPLFQKQKGMQDDACMPFEPLMIVIAYFIVGMTNSAPLRMPVGQREVMVLSLV